MSRDTNLEAIDQFDDLARQHAQDADRALHPGRGTATEWQHREAQVHAQTSLAYSAIVANLTAFRFGQGPGA